MHTHTHTHSSTHMKCKQYACSTIPMVLIEKMFAITNLLYWTNVNPSQPVSQLAAKLGSGSAHCGLHSCGRFWTWWWTVWVVPTFSVYFPKSLGHQKTLRLNPFSCSWTHSAIPHEKGNVSMINITVSACQHVIINYVCWNISLWIQRHSLVVFLLRASWCFDIRALLKETNLLPASGQDGCVESHSPDQIPHGRWATGPVLGSAPLSLPFPSPSSIPSASPPRDYSTSSCWKSPRLLKGILHWHSAAISDGHAIRLRMNTTSISIFQGAAKMTTDWFRGRKYFDRENVYASTTRDV